MPRFLPALVLLAASLAAQPAQPLPAPTAEARARVELFLTAMGGRAAWREINSVTVRATHYDPALRHPYANAIFNDFMQPRVRFEATGPEMNRLRAIDHDKGWRVRDGELAALTPVQIADDWAWWEANIYRTLARLANDDPGLVPVAIGERRLEIFRADGKRLNWFELSAGGEPIRFGTWDSEEGSVFGPLASAGSVRYPRWGANRTGTFRYEVTAFLPSREPPTVTFDPPTSTP